MMRKIFPAFLIVCGIILCSISFGSCLDNMDTRNRERARDRAVGECMLRVREIRTNSCKNWEVDDSDAALKECMQGKGFNADD